ncbi:MAG: phosphodiester glycosidase family protein [Candidatus Levybacteria bacterium]|nr:phosphodiester glycosidase family protein [Candidatus Levybacteria bacterium]
MKNLFNNYNFLKSNKVIFLVIIAVCFAFIGVYNKNIFLPIFLKNKTSFQKVKTSAGLVSVLASPTSSPIPTNVPTNSPTPTSTPTPLPTLIPTKPPSTNNVPPAAGYSRQTVQTDTGAFIVDIISADLNSTRVIVDTASDSDCLNNCPTLSLSTYAGRNSAFAGINGSFFCPTEYPDCAGKTNSFDTLLMNKNKVYFNSANNVYSTVPAAIFKDNWARFVEKSLEWGRDTSVDSVIAMQPLLVFNNQIVYNGGDNGKFNSKGLRSFIGATGNTVYIGIISNATMNDSARVLHALSITNALNLDEGGSTALWYGGNYIFGPGRNIPNAVLFVRK